MCGRTVCSLAPADICKACKFKDKNGKQQKPEWKDATNGKSYFPSYNIAPGAHTPVMFALKHLSDSSTDSSRVIQPMLWGLIPSWHKGSMGEKAYETNNCRAESMLEKATYKIPLQKGRRCVILAEGFYEWKREKDQKQPYYIYFPENKKLYTDVKSENDVKKSEGVKVDVSAVKTEDVIKEETVIDMKSVDVKTEIKQEDVKVDVSAVKMEAVVKETTVIEDVKSDDVKTEIKQEPHDEESDETSYPRLLTMAGVFDVWKPPGDSEPVYSYSVITVESSTAMSPIHHRMPALLTTDEEIQDWLNFGDVPLNKASKLIRAVNCVEYHPVSSVVNNSRHNKPECVKKIDPSKPKKSAGSLFMSSWLSKGQKVKGEGEPPTKKAKVI